MGTLLLFVYNTDLTEFLKVHKPNKNAISAVNKKLIVKRIAPTRTRKEWQEE